MRYRPLDPQLFVTNRKRLRERLEPGQTVVVSSREPAVRNNDSDYPFRQDSNFFWATGIDQSDAVLVLSQDDETLYTRDATELEMIWIGPRLSFGRAKDISGVDDVKPLKQFKKPQKAFNASKLLAELRMIKSDPEVAAIRQAIEVTRQGFELAVGEIQPGIKEFQIEAELAQAYLTNAATHAYQPIVAGGKNAVILHYVDNEHELNSGDAVLIDSGAEYANYAADITRVYPVNGKFTDRQRAVYAAVLRIQKAAIQMLKPGIRFKDYEQLVGELMTDELIELGLLTQVEVKLQDPKQPLYRHYYMHGTSHFLGLDVHDPGDYTKPLEPGMVLTCEPGIYIKEEGIGVRLEDDILITKDGAENLSASIPIELDQIET